MKLDYSYIGSLCAFRKLNKRTQHTYKIYLTAVVNTAINFLLHCKNGVAISHTGTLKAIDMLLPLAFFCFMQGAKGQTTTEIKPLEVGDTIPEELWHLPLLVVNHPDGKDTITLNDYRDKKLIILDFWATWCLPCVKSMDVLNNIQKQHVDRLQIIPVSIEPCNKIEGMLTNRNWSLFSLYGPSDLKLYFPHLIVPHQAWILENKVLAITNGEEATEHIIGKVLQGNNLRFKTKKDISIDPTIHLASSYLKRFDGRIRNSTIITGYLQGISGAGILRKDSSAVLFEFNRPIYSMIRHISHIPTNRFRLKFVDTAKYINRAFNEDNIYCFQVLAPSSIDDGSLSRVALKEIYEKFDIRVEKKILRMPVWVIGDAAYKVKPVLESGKVPMSFLMETLNHFAYWKLDLPIFLNESSRADIDLLGSTPKEIKEMRGNPSKMADWLRSNGLEIKLLDRDIEFVVLSEKGDGHER